MGPVRLAVGVEWLVDGEWLSAAQAKTIDKSKLTHFRMQGCNAVALNGFAKKVDGV